MPKQRPPEPAKQPRRKPQAHDADEAKGAVEDDPSRTRTDVSLSGQLPHRPTDELIDGSDTDFPEPGQNPEHSGQKRKR